MKYPDFLSAAKRHSHVCRILQEKIDVYLENDEPYDEEVRHLVINMYYLSGYIIECSLKFKILELKGFDSEMVVDKNECLKIGIDYNKQFKIHRFKDLQELLDTCLSDISHESTDQKVGELLAGWDPLIRYKDSSPSYQDVKELYKHTTRFLRKM